MPQDRERTRQAIPVLRSLMTYRVHAKASQTAGLFVSYSVGIGFVFVGDCPYICVIYILAVVCRLVMVANKKN